MEKDVSAFKSLSDSKSIRTGCQFASYNSILGVARLGDAECSCHGFKTESEVKLEENGVRIDEPTTTKDGAGEFLAEYKKVVSVNLPKQK
jgi:hypothetical protein